MVPTEGHIQPGARVRIRVEDVSCEDRAAPVLSEADFLAPTGLPVLGPFVVHMEVIPGLVAGVRIHIDQDGNGEVRVGDLVSFARHTVSVPAEPDGVHDLEIPVQLVRGAEASRFNAECP